MEDFPTFVNDDTSMRMFTRFNAEEQEEIMSLPDEKRKEAIRILFLIKWRELMNRCREIQNSPAEPHAVSSTIPFDVELEDPSDLDIIGHSEI